MEVAHRACRTGWSGGGDVLSSRRPSAPLLTEPVSGAVPSHFAGVLVAVAEDRLLIASWQALIALWG